MRKMNKMFIILKIALYYLLFYILSDIGLSSLQWVYLIMVVIGIDIVSFIFGRNSILKDLFDGIPDEYDPY